MERLRLSRRAMRALTAPTGHMARSVRSLWMTKSNFNLMTHPISIAKLGGDEPGTSLVDDEMRRVGPKQRQLRRLTARCHDQKKSYLPENTLEWDWRSPIGEDIVTSIMHKQILI